MNRFNFSISKPNCCLFHNEEDKHVDNGTASVQILNTLLDIRSLTSFKPFSLPSYLLCTKVRSKFSYLHASRVGTYVSICKTCSTFPHDFDLMEIFLGVLPLKLVLNPWMHVNWWTLYAMQQNFPSLSGDILDVVGGNSFITDLDLTRNISFYPSKYLTFFSMSTYEMTTIWEVKTNLLPFK